MYLNAGQLELEVVGLLYILPAIYYIIKVETH